MAERANADEFIKQLPDGYDAIVGERGVKLSGGQRQRLSIARALSADSQILILDEATSNLDSESAHADQILVMEGGEIVETGTHESLMEKDDAYATMVRRQHEAVSLI